MNLLLTHTRCCLGVAVALSSAACEVVDHPVGGAAQDELSAASATTGEPVATSTSGKQVWSQDIVRECAGGVPEILEENCGLAAFGPPELAYSVAIVVDQSLRMATPIGESAQSRWEAVRDGLVNLQRDYTSPDGSEVSLVFSGNTVQGASPQACASDAYAVLSSSASNAADDIAVAFESMQPTGEVRPLIPASEAAFGYLQAQPVTTGPYGRFPQKLIILITSGAPDACASEDAVAALTATADSFLSVPIPTYVIELDSEEALDSVAKAGRSERAASIVGGDVAAQVEQAVRNALDDVRFGEYCTFEIPMSAAELAGAPMVINLDDPEQVPLLDSPEACDTSPAGGWYPLQNVQFNTYRFCPCTCTRAARFGGGHLVTFPCPDE